MKMTILSGPTITWDIGTAYDLFVSLAVLHHPESFGLRPSWAAGVRSRFPEGERKFLEEIYPFVWVPLDWIYQLPAPKDASRALEALGKLPPEEQLRALMLNRMLPSESQDLVLKVSGQRSWNEKDLEALRSAFRGSEQNLSQKELSSLLNWWSKPREFGEHYLSALATYQSAFFAEEERRIWPVLQEGLSYAQDLASGMSLPDLVEELSQGVHFNEEDFRIPEVILAPTYWSTPLVIYSKGQSRPLILLFGVRPAGASLVPGEQVPDALLQALKALADATRLRILRYLFQDTLTPSELSRRLRLRAPTVTHHLNALRLAGLVRLDLQAGGEKRYAAREEGLHQTLMNIHEFLETNPGKDGEEGG